MLFFLPKKPVLTPSQLERLSNIFDNAGQGFFVVFLLTQAVTGFDKINTWVLGLGAIAVAACWTASLILAKKEVEK
jgi:hypothetical protein